MSVTALRPLVNGTYDLQKLRIAAGNRLVAQFRARLGFEPGEPNDKDAEKIIDAIKLYYRTLTAGLADPRRIEYDEVISTYTEAVIIEQYLELEKQEAKHFRAIGKAVKDYPIYNEFMKDVGGLGSAMAAVMISYIDIHKAVNVSKIWMYCGLDVAPDGKGRSWRKEHLITRKYINKEGEEAEKLSITYNPFLKTKLMGVLADNFIKFKSPYADNYYNYKHRLENHSIHKEKTKLHRHNMAKRYMVKMFLLDLYTAWRKIEGLPITESYSEGKLGHVKSIK